jgi:tetraacyldisaccharide 4'-kinase
MKIPDLQQQLSSLLLPFSALYGLIMSIRRTLWEARIMPSFRAPCACVSVGNIAWGGSGKTPLVEWLMHWAAEHNVKAATLSRGYGAQLQRPPVMVSLRHTAREVGDEPLMLTHACPKIPVLVDPERRRAAKLAVTRLRPELIFLDDAFQHLGIERDLNLVLLRPEDLGAQWNRVIPAGSWREPESALRRADAFLIKCPPSDMETILSAAAGRLEIFGKPVFTFSLVPLHLRRIGNEETLAAADLGNRAYILVTGVADPEQVKNTITSYIGYGPEQVIAHPDHHRYTFREVERMIANRKMIICTPKDAAKLRLFYCPNTWYPRLDLQFGPTLWTDASFPDWWSAWRQTWLRSHAA